METKGFENAPEDVLLLISRECSCESIVMLSMVNKRFKALFEPRVYNTIDWCWEEQSVPPIVLLLRTILARPELCAHIRNVKLSGETFHLPPFRMKLPPKLPVPTEVTSQLRVIVEESKMQDSELWIEKLGEFDQLVGDIGPASQPVRLATMDALLAVLFSRLPNLASLQMGPNFTKETTMIGSMFKHALCMGNVFDFSGFEMLEEVHFSPRIDVERRWGAKYGNDERPNNTTCPLTFLYALAIKHITAVIEEPEKFEWPSSLPPISSTLTSLDLTLLREDTMGNILSCCPNLKTLKYNFYADKAGGPYFGLSPVLSSAKLADSLAFVRSKLKSLTLTCFVTEHDFDGMECEPEGLDSPISSFDTFRELEHLEVPFVYLLGYESEDKIKLANVLPHVLKTLKLTDVLSYGWFGNWNGWDAPARGVIEEWLNAWRESTPRLEKLYIGGDSVFDFEHEIPFDHYFAQLSAGAGVAVEVIRTIDDDRDSSWPRVFERASDSTPFAWYMKEGHWRKHEKTRDALRATVL